MKLQIQMSYERKDNPYSPVGGLSVLFGNIAPEGGVIKVGAVDPSIKEFTGKAIVFDSQEAAQEAIDNGTVQSRPCRCHSL